MSPDNTPTHTQQCENNGSFFCTCETPLTMININECLPKCQIQSETIITGSSDDVSSVTQHETVSFVDAEPGSVEGLSMSGDDYGALDATQLAGLSGFLSRPVRIYNSTWLESDPIGTVGTVFPWYAFFNDTAIKSKLDNFSWVRCNLHVKIIVNASPFYYGARMISYRPLPAFKSDNITITADFQQWVGRSQRPHIWVLPQDCKGGELVLPFFYYKNWLNLQSGSDLQTMGQLTIDNVVALASANGAIGTGVTVQMYAWAEDIELSGPSVGLAVQSQDEYGTGPVSAPASALARFAGNFTSAPGIIGKMATATRIGAGAISGIASLFGFTNVPVIEECKPVRPQPFANLSTAAIGYPVDKLTLDPKNELSIDPGSIGLPNMDELQISYLVQKESLLTTTYWDTSDLVDAQLFRSAISPWMFRDVTTATQHTVTMPPCAWVANMFAQWRGDIIFRFQFIKSKYHRGRVLLSYDPSGQGSNNVIEVSNTSSRVYTRIVDLSVEDSVEIRIPYSQAYPWLDVRSLFGHDVWQRRGADINANFTYNPLYDNGTLTMRVLNILTAPVASSSVGLIISVRGAENLEFANPNYIGEFSPFTVQSSDVFPEKTITTVAGKVSPDSMGRELINFGEKIVSLRQLLRRSCLNEMWWEPSDTTNSLSIMQHEMTKFPVPYGFDPNGIGTKATGLVAGTPKPFNFTWSTPINWVMPAFVGVKGSTFWTFNATNVTSNANTVPQHIRVHRNANRATTPGRYTTVQALKNVGGGATGVPILTTMRSTMSAGHSGQAITNGVTNTGLTVGLPNYTKAKFQSTDPTLITYPAPLDGGDLDCSTLEIITLPNFIPTRGLIVEKYVGIGTDFNLFWFLNVPTSFFYIGTITQVA